MPTARPTASPLVPSLVRMCVMQQARKRKSSPREAHAKCNMPNIVISMDWGSSPPPLPARAPPAPRRPWRLRHSNPSPNRPRPSGADEKLTRIGCALCAMANKHRQRAQYIASLSLSRPRQHFMHVGIAQLLHTPSLNITCCRGKARPRYRAVLDDIPCRCRRARREHHGYVEYSVERGDRQ